ncbi:MAG TPA: amidohydrolase family protein [Polyangiaceae bacterium]|nr:amidohydrolase family protein [Polyangiaceae bacterium]
MPFASDRRVPLLAMLALSAVGCSADRKPDADLVITHVTVLAAPGEQAVEDATLVFDHAHLSRISTHEAPPSAKTTLDGRGLFATAGFWNSHVHFMESVFAGAAKAPVDQLQGGLDRMLNRYGFTSVVDTGSDLYNTMTLRARIESGELRGPRIRTTGAGFVPPGGSPSYLAVHLPELDSVDTATRSAAERLDDGADALKLFTGTFLGVGNVALMPVEFVTAAVEQAHRRDKLAMAHPQSLEGVRAAIAGNVDIVAHTAPGEGPWPPALLDDLIHRGTTLIPTLMLWRVELSRQNPPVPPVIIDRYEADALAQISSFASRDGVFLFGTDVGYIDQYDPTEEYRLLAAAGLSYDQVLASLTTNPARVWESPAAGTLQVGNPGDVVLLADDPRADLRNFAHVRFLVRGGRIVFGASGD